MPLLALLAAALLLLSTQATGARWTDAATVQRPKNSTITTGELRIAAVEETITVASKYPGDTRLSGKKSCGTVPAGYRNCSALDRDALATFRPMRGDRIEITGSYAVTAKGDNLRYEITASPVKTLPAAWKQDLSVSPVGETSGPRTVESHRVLTFDGDASSAAWDDVLQPISLDPFHVTVVQTNR